MFCKFCGKELSDNAVGCTVNSPAKANANSSIKTSGKSNISIILGLVGIISSWIFVLIGHIASIIGIILGINEYKRSKKMTGLVLSIIGEACAILSTIIGFILLNILSEITLAIFSITTTISSIEAIISSTDETVAVIKEIITAIF